MSGFSANPAHVRLDIHAPDGAWLNTEVLDMGGFYNHGPSVREAVVDALLAKTSYRPGAHLFIVPEPFHREPHPVVITPVAGTESEEAASQARRIEALQDLLSTLNLYTGQHTWTQLTTEQKELFADSVDLDHARDSDDSGYRVERWWRE
ncbi:MAG TPA: hypothetical protein VF885_00915 [Arthrobacter sp.]